MIRNTEFSKLSAEQKALVMSPDPNDRIEAAKAGLGMEVLIDDPSDYIRYRVAWNDYGWDVLRDDPCISIQELLEVRFGEDRSGLELWAKEHPEQLHKSIGAKNHEHYQIGSVRFENTPEKGGKIGLESFAFKMFLLFRPFIRRKPKSATASLETIAR